MRTKTINVYRFSELSAKAKDRARHDYEANDYWFRGDEYMESIKKLAEHFGGKVSDWSIDWSGSSYSSMSFDMPDMEADDIESLVEQLGSYNPETLQGNGDCVLTGCCYDENAIDGLRRAWHDGERDLTALMEAAYETWFDTARADYDYDYGDEGFGETCEANDYEFCENGEFAK